MRFKNYACLCVYLFACNFLFAQEIRVVDALSGKGIPSVMINVNNQRKLLTDVNGKASLQTSNKGKITFSLLGYQSREVEYTDLAAMQFTVKMYEKLYDTKEVVISANRVAQSKEKLAQQIEVITAKEISRQSLQTSADLLQNTGLVNVQKSQAGGGSPVIRGFEANKVLLVVDGVRMNNAIFRGGHLQNVITVDQNMLERTEVLFGSGSLLYGSDALGGVIHFRTKDPLLSDTDDLNFSGSAFTRYSTANNERTVHADLSAATKKVGMLFSINYSDFDDLRQGKNRPSSMDTLGLRNFVQGRSNNADVMLRNDDPLIQRESGYHQIDFLGKLLLKQSERLTHVLNIQFSNSSDIPRYDRLSEINSSTGQFNHAQWYYGPQKRLLASYQARLKRGNLYDEGNVTLAFQDIEESRHNRRWGSNNLAHRVEQVQVYSFNADFDKYLGGKFDLRYGLEGTYNNVNSTAHRENILTGVETALDTRYPDGGSNTKSIAAYTTLSHALSDQLTMHEGVRISHNTLASQFEDTTFFDFPFNEIKQQNTVATFQLGIAYLPGNNLKLYANMNSGFRAPNVDDISKVFESFKGDTTGGNSDLGTIIVPNPDLKAEKTYNFELGFSKTWSEKLQLSLTGFYTLLRDAIITDNAQFNGQDFIPYGDTLARVQMNVNAATAYITGYTAAMNYQINQQFSLAGSYNYTYGRINDPNRPLDHIAPAFGRASVRYRDHGFDVEAFSLFNAAKKLKDYNLAGEDNLNYATINGMPAWYTLNIRASYQINSYLMAQAGVENILDRSYRVFASGINSAGRNISLSLRANF